MKQKTFERLQLIGREIGAMHIAVDPDGKVSVIVDDGVFEPHKDIKQAMHLAGMFELELGTKQYNTYERSGRYAYASSMDSCVEVRCNDTEPFGQDWVNAICKAIVKVVAKDIEEHE